MKIIFFAAFVIVVALIPQAVAEPFPNIYHGKDFDRRYLGINDNGELLIQWTSTPQRLLDYTDSFGKEHYTDYKIRSDDTNVYFESASGSYVFNKNTCGFNIHDSGKLHGLSPRMSLSHTLKEADANQDVWHAADQNNQPCEYSLSESNGIVKLVASKAGFSTIYDIDYRYGFEWTYKYTNNNPVKTNEKYGFTFVCDGPQCDDIIINDSPMNSTLKLKNEIAGKKIKVDSLEFDPKNEVHDYLWAMKKENNKMIVDFTHAKGALPVGETLVVDPTFSQTGTWSRVLTSGAAGAACPGAPYSNSTLQNVPVLGDSDDAPGVCGRGEFRYILTSIPDTATILDVDFNVTGTAVDNGGGNCDLGYVSTWPPDRTAAQMWGDIGSMSNYLTNNALCTSATFQSFDLGNQANSDVQNSLSSNKYALGLKFTTETRSSVADTRFSHSGGALTIVYASGTPQPATNFDAISQARKVSYTWTASVTSDVSGYYIGRSLNNSTFTNKTLVGTVTSYLDTAYYRPGLLYYVNITATNGLNSTSKYDSFTMDNYPTSPLNPYTTPLSDTSIKLNWSPPSSDGNDSITGYKIQYCITCTSWGTLVNQTNTLNYNHTGLPSTSAVTYRMAAWNGVGLSPYTANFTGRTYEPTTGNISLASGVVGDVIQLNGTITISTGIPEPINISQSRFYVNGVLTQTRAEDIDINRGGSDTLDPFWYQFTSGTSKTFSIKVTASNSTGTVTLSPTANITESREYDPDYFTAVVPSEGSVNYTEARLDNGEVLNLKINRDKGGQTFQVECKFRDIWETINGEPGTWVNRTTVGFYNVSMSVDAGDTVYFDCYNDNLLFSSQSYGNSTDNPLINGIRLFDNFGGLVGAQSVILIIIAIFFLATGKNSPQILVLGMIVLGVLAGLNLLVFDEAYFGLLMAAAAVGLFAMKRYYF